jgi:hypothetical protein
MTSFLNSSIIDFSNPLVSVKSTGMKLGLGFPLSVKNMLSYRDKSKTRYLGICVCQYGGQPRGTKVDADWLNRTFSDPMGIARYFRKMSGGRQLIEWQVFIPGTSIMPYSKKLDLEAQVKEKDDTGIEFDATREAASQIGIPVESFNTWIWIIDDDNVAVAGTTAKRPRPGDIFVAAQHLRPNLFCHELAHSFGIHRHASRYIRGDYGDSFCILGDGRTFENPRFISHDWFVPFPNPPNIPPEFHSNSGPGICVSDLYALRWLDSATNLNWIHFFPEGLPSGSVTGSIFANQGGPPVGSPRQIGIVITFEWTNVYNNSEYWIEYRIPQGFDRGLSTVSPQGFDRGLVAPPEGIILLRELSSGNSFIINWIPAKKWEKDKTDGVLRLPKIDYIIKITDVDVSNQKVSYILERN